MATEQCQEILKLYHQDIWTETEVNILIKHSVSCPNCGNLLLDELSHILSVVSKRLRLNVLKKTRKP